jgi:AcrR family transcriptional regulator
VNKTKIRRVAIDEFATRGYHGASLRHIAKASGVTLGTVYHYYPSKQDLLAELMQDVMEPLIASGHAACRDYAGDAAAQLFHAVHNFVSITLEEPQLAIIADVELRSLTGDNAKRIVALRDEYEDIIRTIVEAGASSGAFDVADAKMATFAVLAISNQPAYWFHAGGTLSAIAVADAQATLALRLVTRPTAVG